MRGKFTGPHEVAVYSPKLLHRTKPIIVVRCNWFNTMTFLSKTISNELTKNQVGDIIFISFFQGRKKEPEQIRSPLDARFTLQNGKNYELGSRE